MTLEERVFEIEKLLKTISKKLDSNIVEKARKYDEVMFHLSNINIEASLEKKVDYTNGDDYLLVEYNIQPTKITCDEDCNIEISDQSFFSMNMLDLLGMTFTEKVQKEIEILKMLKK